MRKKQQQQHPLKGSFTSRIAQFTKILTDAGHKHVGKVKPGRKTRVWLTPPVRAAIRQRNYLRRKIKTHRREWLEQCEVTRAEIEKAKQQKWKDVVEEAITTTDDRKIWSFVKSISGTPDAPSTGEVMKHKGKVISSNSRKANIFSSHYASVSKLTFDKNERSLNREAKRMLNSKSVGHQSCRPFTMSDLKTAIRKMKSRGAPGADDIPPSFIKALDPTALAVLLSLFNESFEGATIPQAWRFAIIIPLLKMGKPSSALGSYRPVSLTSCLVKTLERMIADRLYAYVESNNLQQSASRLSTQPQLRGSDPESHPAHRRRLSEEKTRALHPHPSGLQQGFRSSLASKASTQPTPEEHPDAIHQMTKCFPLRETCPRQLCQFNQQNETHEARTTARLSSVTPSLHLVYQEPG